MGHSATISQCRFVERCRITRIESGTSHRCSLYVANVDTATRNVRLYTDVQVKLPFEKFDKVKAVYTLSRHGKEIYKGSSVVVSPAFRYIMEIKNADLWWPRGYGEPALYDAKVELVDSDGTILSTDNKRVGLRTIQLDIQTSTSHRIIRVNSVS